MSSIAVRAARKQKRFVTLVVDTGVAGGLAAARRFGWGDSLHRLHVSLLMHRHQRTLVCAARGFTTLSGTLGRLAAALHAGLLQALTAEPDPAVAAALLRALTALVSASPYPRLPPELLPQAIQVQSAPCPRRNPPFRSGSCPVFLQTSSLCSSRGRVAERHSDTEGSESCDAAQTTAHTSGPDLSCDPGRAAAGSSGTSKPASWQQPGRQPRGPCTCPPGGSPRATPGGKFGGARRCAGVPGSRAGRLRAGGARARLFRLAQAGIWGMRPRRGDPAQCVFACGRAGGRDAEFGRPGRRSGGRAEGCRRGERRCGAAVRGLGTPAELDPVVGSDPGGRAAGGGGGGPGGRAGGGAGCVTGGRAGLRGRVGRALGAAARARRRRGHSRIEQ